MVSAKLPSLIEEREVENKGTPLSDIAGHGRSFTKSLQATAKTLSPETFVDGQTKDFLKGKLHENQLLLWRSSLEAAIYCAVFHEIKRFFRNKTSRFRRVGPVVQYTTNVMLPNGLFGPIIGFVLRLKFFR